MQLNLFPTDSREYAISIPKARAGVTWKPRKDGSMSDCNSACQSATGPACDCKCHGANHGVSYNRQARAWLAR